MAYEANLKLIPGLKAGADLSAATMQYKLVKLSAAGTVIPCAATTDEPIGVLQNRPKSGEGADVAYAGVSKCRAGDEVTLGEPIGPDADGDGHGTTTANHYTIGKALTVTTGAGGYFSILLNGGPAVKNFA